ncbi:MAG: response regulator, partial [Hyphomicrobiales bacterium]|nr:response regulator [Hyphomicrobiales bacterium]
RGVVDGDGRRMVVRNGHAQEREIQTPLGQMAVKQPRVNDKRLDAQGQRLRFTSAILPPYLRRTKAIEELIPWLYLKGVSTGDFTDALSALLGKDAPGMSATTVEKVFEPFFTTKPVGQGTGLGLSMIYGFARQSGGHIRIYSEPNQGTTVKLFLPRSKDSAQADVLQKAVAPRGAGETVMVVEDDTSVRLIVTEVLDQLGYSAIEAVDAVTAIPILQSQRRIDLLVTDVGLPGLNGRQLAEIARQSRPDLKVLFVTGYAQNAAVRSGFLDPGMDMMTKPFAVDALATKIREILEV